MLGQSFKKTKEAGDELNPNAEIDEGVITFEWNA
jgi:hypothetical protein